MRNVVVAVVTRKNETPSPKLVLSFARGGGPRTNPYPAGNPPSRPGCGSEQIAEESMRFIFFICGSDREARVTTISGVEGK